MKEAFFIEEKDGEGVLFRIRIYVPDYYTRGMGLKGIWILGNGQLRIRQDWMDIAWKEGVILFVIHKSAGRWQEEDVHFIRELVSQEAGWMNGGFGILSAYRYLIGVGNAGRIAENMKNIAEHANMFAKIHSYEEKDFEFSRMWKDVRGYRRIIFNPFFGSTLSVRDMGHLRKHGERIDGVFRTWYTFWPSCKQEKYPLVLAFHGITSNGEKFLEQTGWDILGEKYGFGVVAITGYLNRWNISDTDAYPSDIRAVKKILELTEQEFPIDEKRIYLMGFSMGAAMVHLLHCRLPYTFAAAVAFSGQLAGQDEDAVALLKGKERKTDVYQTEQKGIPRKMWIAYGEEEKPWEYPGNRKDAVNFWLNEIGADKDQSYCVRDDKEVLETAYPGKWGELHTICQKHTGHAYHPELMEYIYQEFFRKNVREE